MVTFRYNVFDWRSQLRKLNDSEIYFTLIYIDAHTPTLHCT